TFGITSFDDALEAEHSQALQRLGELEGRLQRLREDGAPGAHIRQTEQEIQQTLNLLNELEDRLMSKPLEVTIDRGTVVGGGGAAVPPAGVVGSGTATVDAQAQAALAA